MTDRDLMQQALDALETADEVGFWELQKTVVSALRDRLAHCDRCGKRHGGEGHIHTCVPDPIGDAQDRLIAELAAQPEQEPVAHLTIEGGWVSVAAKILADGVYDLYTTPPAQPTQQGLADEIIKCFKAAEMACECSYMDRGRRTVNVIAWQRLMQAVAACAHGIKEST